MNSFLHKVENPHAAGPPKADPSRTVVFLGAGWGVGVTGKGQEEGFWDGSTPVS